MRVNKLSWLHKTNISKCERSNKMKTLLIGIGAAGNKAAIAAAEGTSTDGFVVRSIKRR